ncbi:MAG: LolA family protein [Pseudomonadales bacterium]
MTKRSTPKLKYLAPMLVFAALASLTAFAQSPKITWSLNDALKQINRQSSDFQTALARVQVVRRNQAGEEVNNETATIYINRDGRVRIDVQAPDQRTYLVTKKDLFIHMPERMLVQRYSLSKHKNRLEPYARLGFTNTGKDLKDDYLVTSLGEQDIGESRALGLELTPKKERLREVVAKAQLWIDQASWMPTRQMLWDTQSGDSLSVTYTHTARNLKLNPDLFKTQWPRGTQKMKL